MRIRDMLYVLWQKTKKNKERTEFIREIKKSANVTVPAGGIATAQIDTVKEGYTLIGILGLSTYHGNVLPQQWWIGPGGTYEVVMRNVDTVSRTTKAGVMAIYQKI